MPTRSYENFDLLIETEDASRYRARVTSCPVGDTPASEFSLPFSPTELENLLLKLDPGRSGMRRIADPFTNASIELGGGLFNAVFRNGVLVAWSRSKDAAREKGHGLRLRLHLTDAPLLAALPWELLYDKSSRMFYAQSDRTPVVRYLDVTNPPRPLRVQGPLRILVIIASPHGLPRLDVEREWAAIREALADRQRDQQVRLDLLPAPSIAELQTWLRHNTVHVLHFVGHGDFDDRVQDGMLVFCDKSGQPTPVSSAVLGAHIRDHDPLRLVVLNACQTARSGDDDPYSGMAQGLIQQEAAAVVAMQFPISDDAAIVFTREFYGAVSDGEPLDQAMASARKALLADHGPEWATPVLFLRAADGRVFDREPMLAVVRHQATWSPHETTLDAPRPQPTWSPHGTQQELPTRPHNPQKPMPAMAPPRPKPPLEKAPKPSSVSAAPSPRRHRRRHWIVAAAAIAIALLAAVIAVRLGHQPPSPTVSQPTAITPTAATPASVITAWYNAINRRDWQQVQRLWPGDNPSKSLAQVAEGFAGTRHDYITVTATNGDEVSVLLVAAQTDGTGIYHVGYRVRDGVIIQGWTSSVITVPSEPAIFSTFSGYWLGRDRALTISPEGLGIAQFRVSRSCTNNPSPPCDSISGNQAYPGGAIVFQLTSESNNSAQGNVMDSSVPGRNGPITVTFQPSADSVVLTTAGGSGPVTYCGPRAHAGLCGS